MRTHTKNQLNSWTHFEQRRLFLYHPNYPAKMTKIAIIHDSMYGHVATMSKAKRNRRSRRWVSNLSSSRNITRQRAWNDARSSQEWLPHHHCGQDDWVWWLYYVWKQRMIRNDECTTQGTWECNRDAWSALFPHSPLTPSMIFSNFLTVTFSAHHGMVFVPLGDVAWTESLMSSTVDLHVEGVVLPAPMCWVL
jgi:hypothetical protein